MTFLVDERVIMHYYAQYPLVNEESNCTASFHSSWLFFEFVPKMAKTKTTRRRRSHPSGGMQLTWDFIDPLYSQQEIIQEIHRTKV